ncbi:hypothetical protein HBI06_181370 [Parastagonospora nodorum]|nr:hypothetical protein HBI06_181370 [Parastagonospora nodorum]KAH4241176.1 hypothetical protein HBI05_105840 [Parastagonospora nodorum]
MSAGLHVIALISGGKDSLFSILHCRAQGYTVVALANLHPQVPEHEDIDSYMYQTVGHAVIPLYADALGIPLYRQPIAGSPQNSRRDYECAERDETEDLVPLLSRVMEKHPEANALSTGAILSTYQRTRVESVALRLGLTPLSYLWQYPLLPPYMQSSLLSDMAAVGQEALIIKTASGGLDESFLGLDVVRHTTVAKLKKAMGRFGEAGDGAIVGEGGEFETLAIDGPSGLWKKKIRIGETERVVLEGGQTVLKIKECGLEEKERGDGVEGALRIPELFDQEFKDILDAAENNTTSASAGSSPTKQHPTTSLTLPTNTHAHSPIVFTSSNLSSPTPSCSPSHQLTSILLRLSHILTQSSLPKSRISHTTLLLRHMSTFTTLNPIYATFFSTLNPPSRVTIACGPAMPRGVDVMLSVVLDKTPSRQGLHVQSRSYWAPANIGPYSQAISAALPDADGGEVVYVAGQIPLVPASMEIYAERGFAGQVVLALQHLWRVGRAKGVRGWIAGVGFVPAQVHDVDGCFGVVREAWRKIHEKAAVQEEEGDEESVDPWDRLNGHQVAFNDKTYRAPIPDHDAISGHRTPPCFVVQVEALPRGVDIEWSATGLTAKSIHTDGNEVSPAGSSTRFYAFEITGEEDCERVREKQWANATLYAGRGFEWEGDMKGVQWIPCHRVWGSNGREVRGVIVGRVDHASSVCKM